MKSTLIVSQGSLGVSEGCSSPVGRAMLQLSSAAKIAGLDVLTYVARHLRPPVVASDQFKCFETTWVACDVSVMMLLDDPSAKLAVLRNVNLSSKHHQPFRLRPLCT